MYEIAVHFHKKNIQSGEKGLRRWEEGQRLHLSRVLRRTHVVQDLVWGPGRRNDPAGAVNSATSQERGEEAASVFTAPKPCSQAVSFWPHKQLVGRKWCSTPYRRGWTYACTNSGERLLFLQVRNVPHLDCNWNAELGTNGLIRDQRYRTDHDAGMPMPD